LTEDQIDEHVDRLIEERRTVWPTISVGEKQFELKRERCKAELAEAQRINKWRQEEIGLTAVRARENAAVAKATEALNRLLGSRPATLAGALAFTDYIIEYERRERKDEPENNPMFRALMTLEAWLRAQAEDV
jgi:hypothetical protein